MSTDLIFWPKRMNANMLYNVALLQEQEAMYIGIAKESLLHHCLEHLACLVNAVSLARLCAWYKL